MRKTFTHILSALIYAAGFCTSVQAQTFTYTGAIQSITVPACADSVTITATGAQGGQGPYNSPGLGASIKGTFAVSGGQVFKIVVGQAGTGSPFGPYYCGSGGGGSYVWNAASSAKPMIVAGGGGGNSYGSPTGGPGSADSLPTFSTSCAPGGMNGNGGVGGTCSSPVEGGGGAGWISNGDSGLGYGNGTQNGGGGLDPANGAGGGYAGNPGSAGGYGGGGGCAGNDGAGGGGGGYNGGGGGLCGGTGNWGSGGGGGSYNMGFDQVNDSGVNSGNGLVTIVFHSSGPPMVTPVVINNELCHGDNNASILANAACGTSPYAYSWTPSGGTGDTASGLSIGTYTITVTDANSLTGTASITITQPTILTLSATAGNILCNGSCTGSIKGTPSGGTPPYTYSPDSGLCVGGYTLTVTDANGCSATASVNITEPTALTVSTGSQVDVTCCGNNTGKVTATASGGVSAYTYFWAPNGKTTATITSLTAGTYTVIVTDNNGCTASASTNITQPVCLADTNTAVTDSICKGSCTNITSNPTGGTPAYSFAWNTGATNGTINVCPVSTTTFTSTVTDSYGCTTTASIKVVVNLPPVVKLGATKDTTCVNATKDSLIGTPPGGTYSGTSVSGRNFDPNTAGIGTHQVKYVFTDIHGCIDSTTLNVVVGACLGIDEVNSLDGQIKFYPNPFSQSINVDISYSGSLTITMFNMLGENVGSWVMDKGLNTINTQAYPSGVYMIQVKSKDGLLNKKLVKVN